MMQHHWRGGAEACGLNRAFSSGVSRFGLQRVPAGRWGLSLALLAVLVGSACNEEGTVTVRTLELNGVKAIDSAALKRVLATKESSKLPWGKKNNFDRARFDADLKRIQAFYSDRGYPNARVSAFDVRLNRQQDQVDITLNIEEGDPVRIADIRLDGFSNFPEDRMRAIRAAIPFKIGDVRDRQMLVETQAAVLNQLRDSGFAYARVWVMESPAAPGELAISVTADPGSLAHFGQVEISGNQSVGEAVIRRELLYRPGDQFSRSAMLNTQRRLYGMELFQFATVNIVDGDKQNPEVKTRVTIAEGKHQTVNFGVGYGTEEKGRVDGEYRQRNFLGAARAAGIRARWSSLDRGVRGDVTQPYFVTRDYSLRLEGQQWYTYTPAFRSIASGGRATIIHKPRAERHSWSVSFISEHTSSAIASNVLTDLTLRNALIALGLDPVTGRQEGTLNAVAFDAQLNATDNILDARRGYQIAGHLEQAGRIAPGTFAYTAMSGDLRHYVPLSSRFTLANRVQFGTIDGAGDASTSVPFAKKFFLGGATSIRGWGRYDISPLSGSGLPIGGDSMLAVSTEGRVILTTRLGAVVFIDAGNVWAVPWMLRLDDLRYAVGPGIRYGTPLGPIRFDFGYQLNPISGLIINGEPEKRRWRIHFSIGQAF